MLRSLIALVALFLLSSAPPAVAQDDEVVEWTVTARDGDGAYWFEFDHVAGRNPAVTLEPGRSYRIQFANEGNAPHNLHVGGAVDAVEAVDAATAVVGPGETEVLEFTVPAGASGSAAYWCDPHRSIGMEGAATFGNAEDAGASTPFAPVALVAAGVALAAVLHGRRPGTRRP